MRASDGAIYLGTGNDGRIYRLRGDVVERFAETGQLLVSALAIGEGGVLYAGTLPEGARVVRGASIHSTSVAEVDPAFRRAVPESWHPHDVGFRCAADPKTE